MDGAVDHGVRKRDREGQEQQREQRLARSAAAIEQHERGHPR
jgi:hypothetical protein